MNNVCSEAGLVRQGKLKCHDGSEDQVNAIVTKTMSRRRSQVFTTSHTHP